MLCAALALVAFSPLVCAQGSLGRLTELFDVRKPDGSGRSPAIVVVPGCGGFKSSPIAQKHYETKIEALRAAGFASIRVDYIGARGLRNCVPDGRFAVTYEDVAKDIDSAVTHLKGLNFVNPAGISLMGWSYGGGATLQYLSTRRNSVDSEIAGIVAFYPYCQDVRRWASEEPVLLLLGAADSVAPPAICKELISGKAPLRVTLIDYPDAHHAFDMQGLPPIVQTPFGPMGYQKQADEKGWASALQFLRR